MTPLRQRLTEDMQLRNFSPHTIEAYVRAVAYFAKRSGGFIPFCSLPCKPMDLLAANMRAISQRIPL